MEGEPKPRGDYPGAWHHVTNRGLAHRPAFEGRSDVRSFLALLARRVHEGQIEVHAFSILTTHFHLLLRSTRGDLSDALMWIENQYVKHFNRLRERDGSLFRSRFRSRIVDTEEYWFNVIRYIDANPVDAELCRRSSEYEFGSARMYCGQRSAPWLSRYSVEQTVMRCARKPRFEAGDYERLFGLGPGVDDRWILERRLERGTANRGGEERGNELLHAAPAHVLDWLRSCAKLADGGSIGLTLAAPAQVERQLLRLTGAEPDACCPARTRIARPWRSLEAGLLRDLCGLTLHEISMRTQVSCTAVWKLCNRHSERLGSDGAYAEAAARVVGGIQEERRRSSPGWADGWCATRPAATGAG
jgi:REP element-mobilizing transposase RayT